jgi:ketosteroid isomerase-like protein
MSQENVELFRRSLDAFNRGDLEAWLASIHPDVSFAPIRAPIEGVYEGHAGIRRFFADNQESFDSFRLNYTDIRDIGNDRLLVSEHFTSVRGRAGSRLMCPRLQSRRHATVC